MNAVPSNLLERIEQNLTIRLSRNILHRVKNLDVSYGNSDFFLALLKNG